MKTFSNVIISDNSLVRLSNCSGVTRSILFKTNATGRPSSFKDAKMASVSSSIFLRAQSWSNNKVSASSAPCHAALTIALSRRRFGLKIPGVSTKIIWLLPCITIPRTRLLVVCTFGVTIEIFCPTMAFINVDLPAFGAPNKATKPAFVCSVMKTLSVLPFVIIRVRPAVLLLFSKRQRLVFLSYHQGVPRLRIAVHDQGL